MSNYNFKLGDRVEIRREYIGEITYLYGDGIHADVEYEWNGINTSGVFNLSDLRKV